MDEGKGKAAPQDDGDEFQPSWPKRPDAGRLSAARPRPDSPMTPYDSPDEDSPVTPAKWTSHPTSHNMSGYPVDDPQATRVLPVVEGASRFQKGRKAQAQAQPPARTRAKTK